MRHLHGVSVRNLLVTPPSSRARGKTIDDADLPGPLRVGAKGLARSESSSSSINRGLHHSRSATDLAAPAEQRFNSSDESGSLLRRPKSTRRRSTLLPWSATNPHARQTRLEDITKTRMADSWFSVHCEGVKHPVYISEVVRHATNPSFQDFDLNLCGPRVSRLNQMTVKLWARPAAAATAATTATELGEFVLLVELKLHLQSLQFLGRSLDNFHQPLPTNSIIFHFVDGVYANLTDVPPLWQSLVESRAGPGSGRRTWPHEGTSLPPASSSYDALMRLANLDECIQDALVVRERLETQIASILQSHQRALRISREVAQARDRLSSTRRAVGAEKKRLRAVVRHRQELQASIRARKEAMLLGRQSQEQTRNHLPDARLKLESSARLLSQTMTDIQGQIRRIAEDLLSIYPIEPVGHQPLAFSIAGQALPNSSFLEIDRDAVAAALGSTAHLVHLLSAYLSVPIPYPIRPYLSHSQIHDPISAALPQRTYPLYPGPVQYRFEYGVFLLNKDIEFLLSQQGLRLVDLRHTLPNLKYLLYVLTARAATGGLPARTAGSIRGRRLLLQRQPVSRLTSSSTVSRRGSEDSTSGGYYGSAAHFIINGSGGGGGGSSGNSGNTSLASSSLAAADRRLLSLDGGGRG